MWSSLVALFLASSVLAQDRSTEKEEASITDPTEECVKYVYTPTSSQASAFPPLWSPQATILPGDTAATDKWNSISGMVPTDILPKGTPTGDFSNVSYSADDPDCWWSWHQCTTPKLAGIPADISTIPEPKSLGFGFDDGPNCSHNAFYDYLTSKNQTATMFYIGSSVMIWPLEAQRAVADGHEICIHTWTHPYMTSLPSESAFAELWYTMQAIKVATGVTPTCWRPPYGDVDDRIRAIATALGLKTIIWRYDTFDWENGENGITPAIVDQNYQGVIDAANNGTFESIGAILLMHELNNYTMQTAMDWYDKLDQAFDSMVPIAVALNNTTPYLETNYTFPTFSEYVSDRSSSSAKGDTKAGNTDGAFLLHPDWRWLGVAISVFLYAAI